VFAGIVQTDKVIKNGETQISMLCKNMTAIHLGSPLQRLAYVISNYFPKDECFDIKYNNFVKKYRETSWESPAATSISKLNNS
jgi:hypothetical protein